VGAATNSRPKVKEHTISKLSKMNKETLVEYHLDRKPAKIKLVDILTLSKSSCIRVNRYRTWR
jgi:hypothetical protein